MKLGGSICFQLIDIFEIMDDKSLTKDEIVKKVYEYQKSLTTEGTGIKINNDFFVFGNIHKMDYDSLVNVKKYVEENLSSITCEAEMKMGSIIAGYDKENHDIKYNFKFADKVYNYAINSGKDVRGHTLVWHKFEPKEVLNAYIEDRIGCTLDEYKEKYPDEFFKKRKEITKEFLGSYMKKIGERYPDCYCFDVLNEIVPDVQGDSVSKEEREDGIRHSMWYEYLGEEYYIDVLELARQNLSKETKLFYNEYGEEYSEKRKAIISLIEKIKRYEEKENRVLLDGVGLQSHYDLSITEEEIEKIYSDFVKTGKEIQVTEIDISSGMTNDGRKVEFDEKVFESIWNKEFECVEKYGIKSFTGWGICDDLNWKSNQGIPITMVDKNGNVKEFAKPFIKKAKDSQNISMEEVIRNAIIEGTTLNQVRECEKVEEIEKSVEEVSRDG